MKSMTIEEVRTSLVESPERLRLIKAVSEMPPEQFADFLSVMKYGWARAQAGEAPEVVVAEWKKEVGRA